MWNLFHLQTQYLLNFCCAIKTEKNIKFGWLSWVGQNWAIFDSSTFLVLDFFFLSDAGWFSIEEAILGLDAEDAKEARARSWQVRGVGLVTFLLPWLWFGLVTLLDITVCFGHCDLVQFFAPQSTSVLCDYLHTGKWSSFGTTCFQAFVCLV